MEGTGKDLPPVVDGFTDLVAIGTGGSATVYAAVEDGFGRPVALKVLDATGNAARRLEREARAVGGLGDIPGVVKVHRVTTATDGRPVLVMELMAESLGSVLRTRGPQSLDQSLTWLGQVAPALDRVHLRGVHHRDVKPDNILLSTDGRAHLVDFGIAAVQEMDSHSTTAMSFSPPYAPPERFTGVDDDPQRGDIYGLGATFYAVVAGAPPFGSATTGGVHGLISRVVADEVPRPEWMTPEVHAAFARAMAKSPADRYGTAGAFLGALRSAAALGTAAPAATPGGGAPIDAGPVGIVRPPDDDRIDAVPVDAVAVGAVPVDVVPGDRPTVVDVPVVPLGVDDTATVRRSSQGAPPEEPSARAEEPPLDDGGAAVTSSSRRRVLVAGAAAAVLVLLALGALLATLGRDDPDQVAAVSGRRPTSAKVSSTTQPAPGVGTSEVAPAPSDTTTPDGSAPEATVAGATATAGPAASGSGTGSARSGRATGSGTPGSPSAGTAGTGGSGSAAGATPTPAAPAAGGSPAPATPAAPAAPAPTAPAPTPRPTSCTWANGIGVPDPPLPAFGDGPSRIRVTANVRCSLNVGGARNGSLTYNTNFSSVGISGGTDPNASGAITWDDGSTTSLSGPATVGFLGLNVTLSPTTAGFGGGARLTLSSNMGSRADPTGQHVVQTDIAGGSFNWG